MSDTSTWTFFRLGIAAPDSDLSDNGYTDKACQTKADGLEFLTTAQDGGALHSSLTAYLLEEMNQEDAHDLIVSDPWTTTRPISFSWKINGTILTKRQATS